MRFIPTIHAPVYPPDGTKKTGNGFTWTARELQVIRERYISEGIAICEQLLPIRSRGSILNQAAAMGLRRQRKHSGPVESNDLIDASLRRLHSRPIGRGELKAWCKQHGRTRQWAYTRSRELGLQLHLRIAGKWHQWSEDELKILEDNALKKPEWIAKILMKAGFNRTPGAISDRLWRIGVDRKDPDIFTGNELSRLMGLNDAHGVAKWIKHEGLKATFVDNGHRGYYEIRRADLREWMIRSASWDHRRVNREFLIETLAGRVGVTSREAAA